MIGSLLRLPHEVVVARMLAALNEEGFDISLTELGVFLYPGPEGRRPSDLARQCNTTRQVMNYVLMNLERRGYVERRSGTGPTTRVVQLTDEGWELVGRIRKCLSEIEREWAAHLGTERFEALRETLRDLSTWLGKLA
jgi:DNA-binding MarR family transcriptional regulator